MLAETTEVLRKRRVVGLLGGYIELKRLATDNALDETDKMLRFYCIEGRVSDDCDVGCVRNLYNVLYIGVF